jgi:hypothetical protein
MHAYLPYGSFPEASVLSFSLQAANAEPGRRSYVSITRIGSSEEETAVPASSTALIDDRLSTERGSSFFDEKVLQAV